MSFAVAGVLIAGASLAYSVYNAEENKQMARTAADKQKKDQEKQLKLAQAQEETSQAEADRDAELARQRALATGLTGRQGTILTGMNKVGSPSGVGSALGR